MPSKKAHTHARIVAVASRLFRRDGFQNTGVDALMAEAGLTRGGFYAHFRAKAALFAEALVDSFAQSRENLFGRGLEELSGRAWVEAASARYLSWKHRSSAAEGCALPSLGTEVARAPRSVRRVFGRELDDLAQRIADRLESERVSAAEARERAWSLLSLWAGAMVLARALPSRALAEQVIHAARGASLRVAAPESPSPAGPSRSPHG